MADLAKRDIAPVDRLTRPAGVVDTKVKSIGGCTGGGTATNYGVCSAGKLIGYAGKVNGCAAAVVDPGILSTHHRHIGIGNHHSSKVY